MSRARRDALQAALERAIRRNDAQAPEVREHDAAAIAVTAIRHWGDEAPAVISRAFELAREAVEAWGATRTPDLPAAIVLTDPGPPEPTPLEQYIARQGTSG